MITSMGGLSGLEDITIDGNTKTRGAGNGVDINAPFSFGIVFNKVQITKFSQSCLQIEANCGSTFRAIDYGFYTTGTLGVQAAISLAPKGVDSEATSHHFFSCESGDCPLYNLEGANDIFVFGGYTNGLIFGSGSSKMFLQGVRIGATAGPMTVRGTGHRLNGCIFAAHPVILDPSTTGVSIHCLVREWNIQDNGAGNFVVTDGFKTYNPVCSTSGVAPNIGNGSITAAFTRMGNTIEGFIDVIFGSTTPYGTGTWYFSLPMMDYKYLVQMCGNGAAITNRASGAYLFSVLLVPGTGTVECLTRNLTGQSTHPGGDSAAWASATIVRSNFRYFCE
jgi:hypothetical protein